MCDCDDLIDDGYTHETDWNEVWSQVAEKWEKFCMDRNISEEIKLGFLDEINSGESYLRPIAGYDTVSRDSLRNITFLSATILLNSTADFATILLNSTADFIKFPRS